MKIKSHLMKGFLSIQFKVTIDIVFQFGIQSVKLFSPSISFSISELPSIQMQIDISDIGLAHNRFVDCQFLLFSMFYFM